MPTRRQFVQVTAAAGAATVLGSRGVLGANDGINVGIIGCGGRGSADWQRFLKQPDVNPVAACDVYAPFLAKATAGTPAAAFKDFRRLLDRKDIDAVIIATPDHWHALMRDGAARPARTSTCEKPLVADGGRGAGRWSTPRASTSASCRPGASSVPARITSKRVKLVQDGGIGARPQVTAGFTRNVVPGFVAREPKNGLTARISIGICGSVPRRSCRSIRIAASITSAGSGITRADR